jgi:hypothetical protein
LTTRIEERIIDGQISVPTQRSNTALEFDDSEVSDVVGMNDDVRVSFSAAHVHRSDGATGRDAGNGYEKAVELQLQKATWSGRFNACVGKLSDGELRFAGALIKPMPLPFQAAGAATLNLQFCWCRHRFDPAGVPTMD